MQDYKNIRYNSERRKDEGKKSKRTSLIVLFGLIIIIGEGAYIQKHPLVAQKIEKIVEEHKPKGVDVSEQKRFTFYDILARGEVIIDSDIPFTLKENQVFIQLGAFQSDIEADNFEAKMSLLDLQPKVESLLLPDKGGRWFIVRIGPISNDNEMSMIKTRLKQNNVEYRVVTRKD
jgi:SPOR domain